MCTFSSCLPVKIRNVLSLPFTKKPTTSRKPKKFPQRHISIWSITPITLLKKLDYKPLHTSTFSSCMSKHDRKLMVFQRMAQINIHRPHCSSKKIAHISWRRCISHMLVVVFSIINIILGSCLKIASNS